MKKLISKRLVFCGFMAALHLILSFIGSVAVNVFICINYIDTIEWAFFVTLFNGVFAFLMIFIIISTITDRLFGVFWFGEAFMVEKNRLWKEYRKAKRQEYLDKKNGVV